MKRLVHLAILAVLTVAAPVQAVKRYSCDFEDPAARSRWVLNPTANQSIDSKLENRWYIGAPGNNGKGGAYGLYISDDQGQTAHYKNTASCWNFAYDIVALDPLDSVDYTIYFDYCAMGNMASNYDGLYLLWIPMTKANGDSIKVYSNNNASIPSAYENYIIRLQPKANMDYLNGTSTWRQCAATIPRSLCDGTPHYLAFVWTNGSNLAQQPGGMVDNINITDNRPCNPPTDIKVEVQGKTTFVSWKGTGAAEYEVSAYAYKSNTWYGPKLVTDTFTTFSSVTMGEVDIIVRAKCDEDFYSLKAIHNQLVYYPDEMCVDYLNLDNAVCYVNNSDPSSTITFNDFKVQKVDNGPAQMSSRHTVHFDKNELEPRTGNVAHTVPEGELASVRLGNWDSGDQAERIEFSFDVDTIKYPVLLLKYMPILEAPGHDDAYNPRFKLDILINGQTIGECGQADFNCNDVYANGQLKPGAAAQGWHITPKAVAFPESGREDVVWKDWTTVGVNLRSAAYEGKTLTARLTTHDCAYSAHCGYAYFTLGCSDGKLKGMKCGEINETFEAPDGFAYRWAYAYNERFRRADGSFPEQYVLGRSQKYEAGMHDDSLYVVDCMFVQDSTCYFSLYASTLATNPISVMNKPQKYMNCRDSIYTVTFDASPSWVQEIDHVKGDTLVSEIYHIESYEWTIEGLPSGYNSWSDTITPTFKFPLEGGEYDVTLRTTCGTCESLLHYHLHLDPLGTSRETQTFTLCDADRNGNGFVWEVKADTTYATYGIVDSVALVSVTTSCDSIIYLELLEPKRIFEDTMLLPESLPFDFHGRIYDENTKSLVDTVPDSTDCSITWVLDLEIYESLLANMPQTEFILCEDDTVLILPYDITRGRSLRYSYTFNDASLPSITPVKEMQKKGHYELAVALNPMPYPNVYTGSILLEDSLPWCNVTMPFKFTVRYASSVIAQRWNDVLAVRNAEYNGGYTFDSVQWYIGESPIEGAVEFNYFAGEGAELRFGEPYSALLTRSDGVKLFTCPFVPVKVAEGVDQNIPQLVPISAPIEVSGHGMAYWYDILGRKRSSEPYNNSTITAPSVAGYYLLLLQSEKSTTHRMIVQ